MKKRAKKVGTPTVILLTVLVVVAGIAVFNYLATRSVKSSHIVLPKDADQSVAIAGQSEDYIVVTKENLTDVIASLSRPISYHQSVSAVFDDGSVQTNRVIELWVRNQVMLLSESSTDSVRNILTDGSTAYIWFESSPQNVAQTALPDGVTVDDLVGIPTYETLLDLLPPEILDAGYVQLAAPADNPCVYALVDCGDVGTEAAWVDTASGLLCRAEYVKDGAVFGTVTQTGLETFDLSDDSIRAVFYLPDGSEPFPFTVETETPQA